MEERDVKRLLRRLAVADPGGAETLWVLWATSPETWERLETEELLRALTVSRHLDPLQPDVLLPQTAPVSGEIEIGEVVYPGWRGAMAGIQREELCRHLLVVGMSGAGKSNTMFHVLLRLRALGIPWLVMDWKTSYRWLIDSGSEDGWVFRVARKDDGFRFNPLIPPPGCSVEVWLVKLVDVIKHSYFVGHGVEHLLRGAMEKCYEGFGSYDGENCWPTFGDVDLVLRRRPIRGREGLWLASVRRVLASLTFPRSLGRVVDVRVRAELGELLAREAVLELQDLALADRVFLSEAVLLWIVEYRRGQGAATKLRHLLVIEEAQHLVAKKKEAAKGAETVVEELIKLARELGQGIAVVDQEPSKLSDAVKANTYSKLSFNLGHGKDAREMESALELEREYDPPIDLLGIGEAILRTKRPRSRPVVVRIPLVAPTRVRRRAGPGATLGNPYELTERAREFLESLRAGRGSKGGWAAAERRERLKAALLEDITRYPSSNVVERYRRIGVSNYLGNRLMKELRARPHRQVTTPPDAGLSSTGA